MEKSNEAQVELDRVAYDAAVTEIMAFAAKHEPIMTFRASTKVLTEYLRTKGETARDGVTQALVLSCANATLALVDRVYMLDVLTRKSPAKTEAVGDAI